MLLDSEQELANALETFAADLRANRATAQGAYMLDRVGERELPAEPGAIVPTEPTWRLRTVVFSLEYPEREEEAA